MLYNNYVTNNKFIFIKEGRDMLKRVIRKSVTITLLVVSLLGFSVTIIVAANQKVSLLVFFALVVLFACVFAVSLTSLIVILINRGDESEQRQVINKLKEKMSNEEFVQVLFEPANSDDSRNIQRCLQIFKDFKVTHYAKIDDDDKIIVIAKDANGKAGMPVTMDAARFDRNYKIK